MAKNSSYRRLKGSSFLSSNRLYTESDHLLSSESHFFTEEYLRFYYKDIQAILTRKTIKGKILNICFASMLAIFLIPVFLVSGGWAAFYFISASLFFILLVVNLVKGPTSICHIQTPVQTGRLEAIRRVKGAEKAIAQIKPLIENCQGSLTQEKIQDIKKEEYSNTSIKKSIISGIHEDGTYHKALFAILAVSTIFIIMGLYFSGILLSILSGTVNLAIAAILVIALRKQSRSDLYRSIKTMAWSICGYLGLRYFFSYIIYLSATLQNPGIAYNQWELFKKTASTSPLEHSWILAFYVLFMFFTVVTGLAGLILTIMFQREHKLNQEHLKNEKPAGMSP